MRNFTDATSHNRCRTAARFFRNVRVSEPHRGGKHESTATDDWRTAPDSGNHFDFSFLASFPEFLLRFLHVLQSQLTGFHHVRHHRLAAKQAEQFVDQPALRAFREIAASKILALPILFVQRRAFFASRR